MGTAVASCVHGDHRLQRALQTVRAGRGARRAASERVLDAATPGPSDPSHLECRLSDGKPATLSGLGSSPGGPTAQRRGSRPRGQSDLPQVAWAWETSSSPRSGLPFLPTTRLSRQRGGCGRGRPAGTPDGI